MTTSRFGDRVSGIELIVAAMAAGATAGATNTATAAINDAYYGLKALLVERLPSRRDAQASLEAAEFEPDVWRAILRKDVGESGTAIDQELIAAAERVLTLTGRGGLDVRYSVHTNYGAAGNFSGPVTINNNSPLPPEKPMAE